MITTTAPYSSAENIIKVLERIRKANLGAGPITPALIQKLSFGDEVSRRIVLSLRHLELIEDDGTPTQALRAFENAPTSQYLEVFATHLRGVYEPVFDILGSDISSATPTEIEDQFRELSPKTLRGRMARCFIGLCAYAGIAAPVTPAKSGPKPSRSSAPSTNRASRTPGEERRSSKVPQGAEPISVKGASESVTALLSSGGFLTIALSGKVSDLTTDERAKIFALFDEVKAFGSPKALRAGSSVVVFSPEDTGLAQKFK